MSEWSRRAAGLTLAALLAVAACGDAAVREPQGPGPAVVTFEPLSLDEGLALLGPSDQEIIEAFAANVPPSIPSLAVAYAAFLVGDNDPEAPLGDARRGDLVLANVSSGSYDFRVVCLAGFRQVPCGTADAWRVAGSGPEMAVLAIGAEGSERRDVVVSVAGDTERPMVASRGFRVSGLAEPGEPLPSIEPPFGGCGFATLLTDLAERDSFRPPGTIASDDDLFVLVQPCESEPVSIAVVGLRDGVEVLATGAAEWNRAVSVTGAAALRVPPEWLVPGTEFQAVVFRVFDREAWLTHAVALK